MSNNIPCRFFSKPSGCRSGNRCNFAHISPSEITGSSPQSNGGNELQRKSKASEKEFIPRGVCKNYWSTGQCYLEFSCRYRHERPLEIHTESENALVARDVPSRSFFLDSIVPFLSDAGLAKISSPSADIFSSSVGTGLDPQTTHSFLCRYTHSDYRFHNVSQIYTFVALLNNASSLNQGWVSLAIILPGSSAYYFRF